jgi:hypothetical protein
VEEYIADAKSQGKEAFAMGEYLAAIYFYGMVNARTDLKVYNCSYNNT